MPVPSRRPFRVGTVTDPATGRRTVDPPLGTTAWDLRSGRYRRLLRGVYVGATTPVTPLVMAEAGLLVAGPDSVVSHQTAARVWGGVVPDDGLVHVTCPRRPRGSGVKSHRPKPGQRGTSVRGIPVTTPASTFVDLSDELGLVDLVVLADSLVRADCVLVVVRSKDVYRTPARTLGRIVAAMRARGMHVPRLSDEWRRHFPSLPEDVAVPA